MSDVLDRIRRELQQRLESTRAAAQEHERVRAALEALEHAVKPLEEVTRRAAGGASKQGRRVAARARSASSPAGSATTGSGAATTPTSRPVRTGRRRATGSAAKPTGTTRGRKAASASRTKAEAGERGAAGARGTARPVRARAPRGANREAVLAVVRERPGVTASELAAASGVTGGTLYSLLARLTAQGELGKRDLPGGQTGYALADRGTPVTAASGGDTITEDSLSAHTRDAATAANQPPAGR